MMESSMKALFVIAFILRILLMFYGLYHDRTMTIKYTDIDYSVFTDASGFVLKGESPYERSTYRYTPILALLLQLNHILTHSSGKIIFCACDILVAVLSYMIMKNNFKVKEKFTLLASCSCWLFNPLSIAVSSRGNAESLILIFVMTFLYFLTKPKLTNLNLVISGFFYGFSIHLKIYPLLYCLAIYLFINHISNGSDSNILRVIIPTAQAVTFGLSSFTTLAALTGIFYIQYGEPFLDETYLYHITRQDLKHNFSPYFYIMYISMHSSYRQLTSLIAFIPQIVLLMCISTMYYRDIVFACFIETLVFVSFNKVCTSQYFLWYLGLLTPILPNINMTFSKASRQFLLWMSSQGIWLLFAYLLEFQGYNTYIHLWSASLLFLAINSIIIHKLCSDYKPLNVKPKLE